MSLFFHHPESVYDIMQYNIMNSVLTLFYGVTYRIKRSDSISGLSNPLTNSLFLRYLERTAVDRVACRRCY